MKVMVALPDTEKQRDGDFSLGVPGELVRFPFESCDCPDCGCDRAMAGMASSKGTTIFGVEDRPALTTEGYRAAMLEALTREGWFDPSNADEKREFVLFADAHLTEAARFEAGDELALVDGVVIQRN